MGVVYAWACRCNRHAWQAAGARHFYLTDAPPDPAHLPPSTYTCCNRRTGTATGDIGPGEYGNANNVVKLSEYKAAPKYTMSGRWVLGYLLLRLVHADKLCGGCVCIHRGCRFRLQYPNSSVAPYPAQICFHYGLRPIRTV